MRIAPTIAPRTIIRTTTRNLRTESIVALGLLTVLPVLLLPAAGLAQTSTAAASGAPASDVPPRAASGFTLEPADADLDGRVFYVIAGEDTQVAITSDAPLSRAVATSSLLVGYLATPFELEEGPAPITGGAFRLPVRSLRTGSFWLDEELYDSGLLDAAAHPEITFRVTGTRDVQLVEGGDALRFRLTLTGELGVKGTRVPISVPVDLEYLPDSPRTLYRLPGDLLLLRGRFEIAPTEHGWALPEPHYADRVAETLQVELFLLLAEISPESTLDPAISQKAYLDVSRFQTALVDRHDPVAARELGREILARHGDDAETLYRLAALALAGTTAPPCAGHCEPPMPASVPLDRDLALAEEAARRANEVAEGKDRRVLEALARIAAEKGDFEEAVSRMEQALALDAPLRPRLRRVLEDTLESYRRLQAAGGVESSSEP